MAKEKKEKKGSRLLQNVDVNKSFMGLSVAKLKHLDVESKFTFTFMRLLIIMGIAAVAMFIIIGLEFVGVQQMHNRYLYEVEQAEEVQFHIESVSKNVLWAIAEPHHDDKVTFSNTAREMMAEADEHAANLATVFTDEADLAELDRLSAKIHEVGPVLLTMIAEGASEDDCYAYFEESLNPALTEYQALIEHIVEESIGEADSMYRTATTVTIILIVVAVIVAAIAIIFLIRAAIMLTTAIKQPVMEIVKAANQMATGDLNATIGYESDDELGDMATSMRNMSSTLYSIVEDLQDVLSRLGGGDLIHGSRNPDCYIGDFLPVAQEIRKFRASLANTMGEIKTSSDQVSQGAQNMAQGAQDLAEGSTDQSASVQQLTASVANVLEQTETLAEAAGNGNRMAGQVKEQAD
ncbi:MAG: HAMP domain-containing protein, partial [Lachnospiraceae bacterium]|nr:HAMP domain-containing protein [Lachnospiraceae bacterium]